MARLLNTLPAIVLLAMGTAAADEAPKDRRIAYALTDYAWEVYQTPDGKAECPNGFNDGPREQFAMLFPDNGTKHKLAESQLLRENQTWRPDTSPDVLPFREAIGTVAYGLNLDGKIDADDFTSPDGEKGVDNQLHRAIGCIGNFRGTAGTLYQFTSKYLQQFVYDRVVIELTDVDSLTNDDNVTVTSYRGSEDLMTDATGNGFLPGGSQTVDKRWGKSFIHTFRGKIVDGVLISEPNDFTFPSTAGFEDTSIHEMRGSLSYEPYAGADAGPPGRLRRCGRVPRDAQQGAVDPSVELRPTVLDLAVQSLAPPCRRVSGPGDGRQHRHFIGHRRQVRTGLSPPSAAGDVDGFQQRSYIHKGDFTWDTLVNAEKPRNFRRSF